MRNRALQLSRVLLLLSIIISLSASLPFENAEEEVDNDEMEYEDTLIEEEEFEDDLLVEGDISMLSLVLILTQQFHWRNSQKMIFNFGA